MMLTHYEGYDIEEKVQTEVHKQFVKGPPRVYEQSCFKCKLIGYAHMCTRLVMDSTGTGATRIDALHLQLLAIQCNNDNNY